MDEPIMIHGIERSGTCETIKHFLYYKCHGATHGNTVQHRDAKTYQKYLKKTRYARFTMSTTCIMTSLDIWALPQKSGID